MLRYRYSIGTWRRYSTRVLVSVLGNAADTFTRYLTFTSSQHVIAVTRPAHRWRRSIAMQVCGFATSCMQHGFTTTHAHTPFFNEWKKKSRRRYGTTFEVKKTTTARQKSKAERYALLKYREEARNPVHTNQY